MQFRPGPGATPCYRKLPSKGCVGLVLTPERPPRLTLAESLTRALPLALSLAHNPTYYASLLTWVDSPDPVVAPSGLQ